MFIFTFSPFFIFDKDVCSVKISLYGIRKYEQGILLPFFLFIVKVHHPSLALKISPVVQLIMSIQCGKACVGKAASLFHIIYASFNGNPLSIYIRRCTLHTRISTLSSYMCLVCGCLPKRNRMANTKITSHKMCQCG